MGLKLIGNRKQVPAGIPFKDPRTGRVFDAYATGLRETIRMVIQHRASNPHFYPQSELIHFNPIAVRQEILARVFEVRPDLFEGMAGEPVTLFSPPPKPQGKVCQCGSTEFEEVVCPTCQGHRVTGWKCKSCGKVKRK